MTSLLYEWIFSVKRLSYCHILQIHKKIKRRSFKSCLGPQGAPDLKFSNKKLFFQIFFFKLVFANATFFSNLYLLMLVFFDLTFRFRFFDFDSDKLYHTFRQMSVQLLFLWNRYLLMLGAAFLLLAVDFFSCSESSYSCSESSYITRSVR